MDASINARCSATQRVQNNMTIDHIINMATTKPNIAGKNDKSNINTTQLQCTHAVEHGDPNTGSEVCSESDEQDSSDDGTEGVQALYDAIMGSEEDHSDG